MVFVAAGTAFLLSQRASEPPPQRADRPERPAAIRAPGLQVLFVTMIAVGGIFGAFEVAVIAFAEERGSQAASGPVLAAGGVTSLLAGLWYGTVHLSMAPHRQFLVGIAILGAASCVLPTVDTLLGLTLAALLLGCSISPALIAGFGLAHRLMPPDGVTEGLAWISTGVGLGLALGAPLAGRIADQVDAQSAFLVAAVSGVVAAALALVGQRRLAPVEPVAALAADDAHA
jgi:predicted MFS family arabinose efflux permease